MLASTTYVVHQGHRLLRAETIVGPKRFMAWVKANCPFSHRTANYYMGLAGSGLGIAAIANTGLKATSEEVTRHLGRKFWAKQKTKRTEERRAKLKLKIESGEPLTRSEKKKLRFAVSFRDKIAFRSNQRRQLSEQYAERDLPDLTKAWPHPHQDGQTLFVRFDMPDDRRDEIYVWLPENSHAQASSVIAAATVGRWSGATALVYRWLWLQYNDLGKLAGCQVDDGNRVTGDRVTWEKVQEKLAEISSRAKSISEINPTLRDPFVTDLLDTWREREIRL